jgi:tetratricopeptide (TPR) repeat protein
VAYAGLGRRDDAIHSAKRAVELLPITKEAYRGSVILLELARVQVMTGDLDPAIDILSQLLSVPSIISAPDLRVDPFWRPLQDNPKFEAMLAAHPVPQ